MPVSPRGTPAREVLLDGGDLLKTSDSRLTEIRGHKMGMDFQEIGRLSHPTNLENVVFPLKVQGRNIQERMTRAQEMVDLGGRKGRETSFPKQLSGGEQRRAAIARSLAVEPEPWFLDEHLSALDPSIRRRMQYEFLRLRTMLHKTSSSSRVIFSIGANSCFLIRRSAWLQGRMNDGTWWRTTRS